jgi:type VI secretion system protein VasI
MRCVFFLSLIVFTSACTESGDGVSSTAQTSEVGQATTSTSTANQESSAKMTYDEFSELVKTCAKKSNSVERLACFDGLVESMGLAPQMSALPTEGKWSVSTKTNPLDDSKTVAMVLFADEGTSSYGERVSLVLRCKSNTTTAYINWKEYLGSEANVTYRIGTGDARTSRWSLSTDSQASFFPSNDISFIKQLMEADRFVAQVTPYSEDPETAVFDIRGLSQAVVPLRETCNW